MNWGLEDFVAAATLIGTLLFGVWVIRRRQLSVGARRGALAALVIVVLLIWAEAAVGIFD